MDINKCLLKVKKEKKCKEFFSCLSALEESELQLKIKKEKRSIIQLISICIDNNKVSAGLALTEILFYGIGNEAIPLMRRLGVFKSSKYNFKIRVISEITSLIIDLKDKYNISDDDITYLKSVKSLLVLSKPMAKIHTKLIQQLTVRKTLALKTLFSIIECKFGYDIELYNKGCDLEYICDYTKEDFSEAYSLILSILRDDIGIDKRSLYYIDDNVINNDIYFNILISAVKICKYKEAEILVDNFNYNAVLNNDVINVGAPVDSLEKSIRLGYIQTEMQMIIRQLGFSGPESSKYPSILEPVQIIYNKYKDTFIVHKSEPKSRYVIQLINNQDFFSIFSSDHLFIEDMLSLDILGVDSYEPDKIKNYVIKDGITVLDVIKVQRFFRFVNFAFLEKIKDLGEIDNLIVLQSILPVFKSDILLSIFSNIISDEKAEAMLNLISVEVIESQFIDIQYTPLIKIGDGYILPPSVIAKSNLVRNILCNNSLRPSLEDGVDPMQNALSSALQSKGFYVAVESEHKFNSKILETDLIAFKDGKIFIFECKNAYHPCNTHEMRNSFDHIKKAASQLEIRKNWLLSDGEQEKMFNNLGWPYSGNNDVVTCIALSNRVFNGYDHKSHPVRQAHEILNVLRDGTIKSNESIRKVWEMNEFSVNDLCNYIEGKTTISDFMNSLEALTHNYNVGDKVLGFKTYKINMELLNKITSDRYSLA